MAKVDQTKANMLLSATKTMSLGANKNSIREGANKFLI